MDTNNKVDMLNGPLLKKMIIFALPLALGTIFQQLFNMVDSAVVGQFASSEALAAVGANAPVVNLFINFFVGISVGSSVLIATYIGSGNEKSLSKGVHTSISISLICGLFLAVLVQFVAQPILSFMGTPDNVINLAVLYLRIYAVGMPFILLYNFTSAILRSIGDSKHPFFALIIGGIINVILNLVLVLGFNRSVDGVAIATVTSNVIASFYVLYYLMHEREPLRFHIKLLSISKKELINILKVGVPAGLQGTVFSLSNVIIQSTINSFGSSVIAGSAAAANFEYIGYAFVNGFAQTATTFIGQNYGAKKMDRCRKIWKSALFTGMGIALVIDICIVLLRTPLAHFFTSDPEVIPYAVQRILMIMSLHFLIGTYEITGSSLRGYGKSLVPALLTVFGTCVVRILWVYLVNTYFHTFNMLLLVYPISWSFTGLLVTIYYFMARGKIEREIEVSVNELVRG